MITKANETQVSTDKIVEKLMHRVSKDQIKKLVDVAHANSGQAIGNSAFDPGDDLCPVFHFPIPYPPRFDQFLNEASAIGRLRLFPYGIIALEGVLVHVGTGKVQG